MRNFSSQLSEFLVQRPLVKEPKEATPVPVSEPVQESLRGNEKRLFSVLKTQSERSTKGREVERCEFSTAVVEDECIKLMAVLEGRHSMSVGKQIARRFEGMKNELAFAKVDKTAAGAVVTVEVKR